LLSISLFLAPSLIQADEGGVYSAYDSNTDGYLDRTEFKRFLEKRRVKQAYRHLWVFEKVDVDGDQRISNLELVDTLKKEIDLRSRNKP
jgi:Ca2+-binding EF-hand superfamily protein